MADAARFFADEKKMKAVLIFSIILINRIDSAAKTLFIRKGIIHSFEFYLRRCHIIYRVS